MVSDTHTYVLDFVSPRRRVELDETWDKPGTQVNVNVNNKTQINLDMLSDADLAALEKIHLKLLAAKLISHSPARKGTTNPFLKGSRAKAPSLVPTRTMNLSWARSCTIERKKIRSCNPSFWP